MSGSGTSASNRAVRVVVQDGSVLVHESVEDGSRVIRWTLGADAPEGSRPRLVDGPVFDGILLQAVHGRFEPGIYRTRQAWRTARRYARVLVHWQPGSEVGEPEIAELLLMRGAPVEGTHAPDGRSGGGVRITVWPEPRLGHASWLAGGA
ncbi:MAG: hypothetical protein ACI8PZ_000651 [Myxococcota bacterium]